MRETIFISNKKEKAIFVLAGALIAFGIGFFTAPFILQSIYGLKPGDEGYTHYMNPTTGMENTPLQDLTANACLTEPNNGQDTLIFNSKGLDEVGFPYLDGCFIIAKNMLSQYNIDSVEVDADGNTVITLTKK